jgi:hypothetical protein
MARSLGFLTDPSQLVLQLALNYWGLLLPRTPPRRLVPQLVHLQLLRHSTCLLSHVPLSPVLGAEQTNLSIRQQCCFLCSPRTSQSTVPASCGSGAPLHQGCIAEVKPLDGDKSCAAELSRSCKPHIALQGTAWCIVLSFYPCNTPKRKLELPRGHPLHLANCHQGASLLECCLLLPGYAKTRCIKGLG